VTSLSTRKSSGPAKVRQKRFVSKSRLLADEIHERMINGKLTTNRTQVVKNMIYDNSWTRITKSRLSLLFLLTAAITSPSCEDNQLPPTSDTQPAKMANAPAEISTTSATKPQGAPNERLLPLQEEAGHVKIQWEPTLDRLSISFLDQKYKPLAGVCDPEMYLKTPHGPHHVPLEHKTTTGAAESSFQADLLNWTGNYPAGVIRFLCNGQPYRVVFTQPDTQPTSPQSTMLGNQP